MRFVPALLLIAAAASGQPVTFTVSGNFVDFRGGDGYAELEWLSGASFRFKRDWRDHGQTRRPRTATGIPFRASEQGTHVLLESRYLTVNIDRPELRITVTAVGNPAAIDLGTVRKMPGKIVIERPLAPDEHIYGLGVTGSTKLDIRGRRITGEHELLTSSAGFGTYFKTPATYIYDVGATRPDRMRTVLGGSEVAEEYFYYGPTPKEILEQHRQQTAAEELPSDFLRVLPDREVPGDATKLAGASNSCDLVRTLAQLAMSARLYPAMDVRNTPEPLAALLPILYSPDGTASAGIVENRRRWTPYLMAYLREAFDRGFPLVRPLFMQFPRDAAIRDVADVIMIGDELLIAPPCDDSGKRSFRLPMGAWTDLRDGREYKGRAAVELRATRREWPVLARCNSIVPMQAQDRIELHYFPKLGAEFFLYEPPVEDHSQFHAGPAGDYWRLETESKVRRKYEWVMHHVERPKHVAVAEATFDAVPNRAALHPGSWFYDGSRRNLHILIEAGAHLDHIVNIMF